MCWLKQSNYIYPHWEKRGIPQTQCESSPLENGLKGVKCFVLTPTPVLRHVRNALTEDNDAYKRVQRPFSKNPLFKKLASQRSTDVLVWQAAILDSIDVHTFKFHHYFLLHGHLKLGDLRNGRTIKWNKLPSRWGHKCYCPLWTLYIVWNGKTK